jgi:hypothetical protein
VARSNGNSRTDAGVACELPAIPAKAAFNTTATEVRASRSVARPRSLASASAAAACAHTSSLRTSASIKAGISIIIHMRRLTRMLDAILGKLRRLVPASHLALRANRANWSATTPSPRCRRALDLGFAVVPRRARRLRCDRVDNFWHTLFHEIDHLTHGEGRHPDHDVFDRSTRAALN